METKGEELVVPKGLESAVAAMRSSQAMITDKGDGKTLWDSPPSVSVEMGSLLMSELLAQGSTFFAIMSPECLSYIKKHPEVLKCPILFFNEFTHLIPTILNRLDHIDIMVALISFLLVDEGIKYHIHDWISSSGGYNNDWFNKY